MIERKNRTSNTNFLCIISKGEKIIFIDTEHNPKDTTQELHT